MQLSLSNSKLHNLKVTKIQNCPAKTPDPVNMDDTCIVISCLDYSSMEWGSRTLLAKALKDGSETCRIYATKFLGVLIRSKAHNVAHWGIDLLIGQLFDQNSKIVPIVALNLLDEAADDKMNLEAMVCALQNKDLSHLGTRGELLKTRLLVSSTYGVKVCTHSILILGRR